MDFIVKLLKSRDLVTELEYDSILTITKKITKLLRFKALEDTRL
jgi:hypothetical protein